MKFMIQGLVEIPPPCECRQPLPREELLVLVARQVPLHVQGRFRGGAHFSWADF